MRQSEGTALCIMFIQREKLGLAGEASRNRKGCKLKGKHLCERFRYIPAFNSTWWNLFADSRCAAGRWACLDLCSFPSAHSCYLCSCTVTGSMWFCDDVKHTISIFWSSPLQDVFDVNNGCWRLDFKNSYLDCLWNFISCCCIFDKQCKWLVVVLMTLGVHHLHKQTHAHWGEKMWELMTHILFQTL